MISAIPDFGCLESVYGFYILTDRQDDLQISFGKRIIAGRRTIGGQICAEHGPSLLYQIGPTGHVAVVLYPSKSELARPHEDHIYLEIGLLSYVELKSRIHVDLESLIDYGLVTSIDASPTLGQRVRIGYLRLCSHMQIEGSFTDPSTLSAFYNGSAFVAKAVIGGLVATLLRPWGWAIAVAVAVYLGIDFFDADKLREIIRLK